MPPIHWTQDIDIIAYLLLRKFVIRALRRGRCALCSIMVLLQQVADSEFLPQRRKSLAPHYYLFTKFGEIFRPGAGQSTPAACLILDII